MNLLSFIVIMLFQSVCAVSKIKKVHFDYPVKLLPPITGTFFSTILTHDELTCFGNRDYQHPTYLMTLLCMLPFTPEDQCFAVWGSRSVVIDASGSFELLKLTTSLPHESLRGEVVSVNATRWMELPIVKTNNANFREIIQIHAEPINLCARSNDWRGGDAHFNITFRGAYLRDEDKRECQEKTLMHIGVIFALSSEWLLPYVAAMAVSVFTFLHGLQIVLVLFAVSSFVLCLAPLMLTRRNRYVARLYFNYFFTRISAEDTQTVIRRQLPVFQALFFSSALICGGSLFAYLLYYHGGVDREVRNTLLKGVLSVAIGWFVFFVCRSAERFFRDWLWLALCVGLAQMMDPHLNPLSRDKVVVAAMVISLFILQGLARLMRTSAAQRMERIASPPLFHIAGVMGIRLDGHRHRHTHQHHHKAQSPLRLESKEASLSRFRGDNLVKVQEDVVPDIVAKDVCDDRHDDSHTNALWQQLSSCFQDNGHLEAPYTFKETMRLNLAALRTLGLMTDAVCVPGSAGFPLCCENAVGVVAVPLHVMGPLRMADRAIMFVPLLTGNSRVLKPMQQCCVALSESDNIFQTVVHPPLQTTLALTAQLQFTSHTDAMDFVQMVCAKKILNDVITDVTLSICGDLSLGTSLAGADGTVSLQMQLSCHSQILFKDTVLDRAQSAVAKLLSAICQNFNCTTDMCDLSRQIFSLRHLRGGAEWSSSVSGEIRLSSDLVKKLGFENLQHFLFVVESVDERSRIRYIQSVMTAATDALNVSASCCSAFEVNIVDLRFSASPSDALLLRVCFPLLLTAEHCVSASGSFQMGDELILAQGSPLLLSSHLLAWSAFLGQTFCNGLSVAPDKANKALAVATIIATLSFYLTTATTTTTTTTENDLTTVSSST